MIYARYAYYHHHARRLHQGTRARGKVDPNAGDKHNIVLPSNIFFSLYMPIITRNLLHISNDLLSFCGTPLL